MNDKMRLACTRLVAVRVVAKPWLAGLLVLAVAGCKPDYRISFGEFLQMQQAAKSTEVTEPSEGEPVTIDIDSYFGPYKVGPSDVLNISFAGTDQAGAVPPFPVRVDRNGEIDVPIAGSVKVADKTLEDVEDAIRAAYVPAVYREAVVHVELLEPDTTNVVVVGAVSEPGLIPLRRDQRSMLFAIVGAGGTSDLASGHATLSRIRHPADETTLNLRDPVELQQALVLDPLERGDIVFVHAAPPNTIFVGGLVNSIGPQTYPQGTEITILQAFAAAGGVRTDIFPREGTLIRRMPDGTDVHVKLSLKRLALGHDPNIALATGDILWVPETWDTRIEGFINANVFARAGITVNYNVTGTEFMNRASSQSGRLGQNQADITDPFGFLGRNSALQGIQGSLPR